MIYFYDDSKYYIDSFKTRKDIKAIWVSNKTPNPISKNMPSYYYVTMFHKKYPKNKYATCMLDTPPLKPTKKIHTANTICSRCTIQTGSGLTINEIHKITKRKASIVIFDWDLTLSVCNGLYTPRLVYSNDFVFPTKMEYTFEEMAHFYAGTIERFDAIKTMFKTLRDKGTKIFILTDNPWGKNPTELAKILNAYDPSLVPDEIIYGNNDKINIINKHPFFKLKNKNKSKRNTISWFQNLTRKLFR
jgi:hypothetical protein